jgi:hypothetical protein
MNGWKRLSPEARERVSADERWKEWGPSAIKVKRLARWIQWRGVTQDNPRGVYSTLAEIGQQDCTNSVLIELGWWKP